MPRVRRRLGTALIVLGVLALGYGAAVYFWKDPVTGLYTSWKQHQLDGQLEQEFADYRAEEGIALEPAAETVAPAATVDTTTGTAGSLAVDTATQAIVHPLEMAKHGEKQHPWQVDAITGATVSSRAVTQILAASTAYWAPRIDAHMAELVAPPVASTP